MFEFALLLGFIGLAIFAGFRGWSIAHETDTNAYATTLAFAPAKLEKAGRIERVLINLELPFSPTLFVASTLMLGLLFFLVFLEFFTQSYSLALVAAAGSLVVTLVALVTIADFRVRKFEAKLLDAMDLVITALKGEVPAKRALEQAALSVDGAVKVELLEIVNRLDIGMSVEQSVRRMYKRYPCEGVRLFTQALVAKWYSGGTFSTLLESVSQLMRDRLRLRMKVEGQLAGAKYAGLFSGLLPYILIPFFLWKQPEWFEILTDHPNGPTFLLSAIFLQILGFLWLRSALRVKL